MKAFIVYQNMPGPFSTDLDCYLILEDGKTIASHICSSIGWMLSDLYKNRKELCDQYPNLKIEVPQHIDSFRILHYELANKVFGTKQVQILKLGTDDVVALSDVVPLLRVLQDIEGYVGDYAQDLAEQALEPYRDVIKKLTV